MGIKYGGRGGYVISRNVDTRPRKIIGYNHTIPIYGQERETHYTEARTGVRREYADTRNFNNMGQPRKGSTTPTPTTPIGRQRRVQSEYGRRNIMAARGKSGVKT
tara:strand:- start:1253 stop:1567 length:315 start_codon:yes stop_codon:yes gene_type:complete